MNFVYCCVRIGISTECHRVYDAIEHAVRIRKGSDIGDLESGFNTPFPESVTGKLS